MSKEKPKASEERRKNGGEPTAAKGADSKAARAKTPDPVKPAAPGPVAPMYRKIDWLTFGLVTFLVFLGYYLTLAPDLTLEDSGELATGSFYAGVPHPPGYPVWTIYSWLFTVLVPFSNIAWRVALSSAVAGAFSCGLLALLVSRGSSMILEGLPEFKDIEKKLENWICLIAGLVAGLLMGFNGFMWSQAVIVEVYTLSVLSLMGVLCCLLRWMYAPHQRRYLYWAFFLFGICFTNHQSLLVAAVGIEVAILAADRRLGRDLFLGNAIVFLVSLLAKAKGWVALFEGNAPMFYIYLAIGLGSIMAFIWAAINTDMELSPEAFLKRSGPVVLLGALWGLGAAFYLYMPASSMSNPPMNWGYSRTVEGFFHALSRGQYDKTNPINILGEPKRLVEGFGFLKDGLIEEFAPACLILAVLPFIYLRRMASRERGWLTGLIAIYFCLGVILLLLLNPSPDRMSRELHKVFFTASHVMIAMFIGYGLSIIAAMMITQYQKFRQWLLTGGAIASALGLYIVVVTFSSDRGVAPEATNIFSALFNLVTISVEPSQDWTLQMAAVIGLVLPALWTALVLLNRTRMTMVPMLVVMAALPVQSIMNHWSNNEQRGHLFGYWFGHDMFTPPYDVYPKMAPHAVVFGGTDPGRFNPTYMIFCESFIKPEQRRNPEFDRRDCYLITQNALADGTYLNYIRAHYNRSTQIDPPFFQELVRSKREKEINVRTNLLSKMLKPLDNVLLGLGDDIEKNRRAGSSFFKPEDFTDLNALAARLKTPKADDTVAIYIASKLSDSTRGLLGDASNESKLRKSLAADLNRLLEEDLANRKKLAALDEQRQSLLTASNKDSDPQIIAIDKERVAILSTGLIYETSRFSNVTLSKHVQLFVKEDPRSHSRIRMNRLLLEAACPKEIATSLGGVYPDLEIKTPTPADNSVAFNEYYADLQRRFLHDRDFPNEPRQVRAGEDVKVDNGRMTVSGQTAVMAINGVITKMIFDRNPDHEFYVEESFPLDWMYPYLTPHGIIMKINRNPLPVLDDETLRKDHQFWRRYSERLIGDWVDYDTPVKKICEFAETVYLERDYATFKGDPKFIRDDNAQKAFSKLRSAIAGVYTWRLDKSGQKLAAIINKPPQERQKLAAEEQRLVAEQRAMLREAEFAFKQAFAFCPYSPEALYRYVNVLLAVSNSDPTRVADALLLANTALKLDPANSGMQQLVRQLMGMEQNAQQMIKSGMKGGAGQSTQAPLASLVQLEQMHKANPLNVDTAIQLSSSYWQQGRQAEAVAILDALLANPAADAGAVTAVAHAFSQLNMAEKLEGALAKLVALTPASPEAWYDLAAIRANLKQEKPALTALRKSIELHVARSKTQTNANDIRALAIKDPRFEFVRQKPEYQAILNLK